MWFSITLLSFKLNKVHDYTSDLHLKLYNYQYDPKSVYTRNLVTFKLVYLYGIYPLFVYHFLILCVSLLCTKPVNILCTQISLEINSGLHGFSLAMHMRCRRCILYSFIGFLFFFWKWGLRQLQCFPKVRSFDSLNFLGPGISNLALSYRKLHLFPYDY